MYFELFRSVETGFIFETEQLQSTWCDLEDVLEENSANLVYSEHLEFGPSVLDYFYYLRGY